MTEPNEYDEAKSEEKTPLNDESTTVEIDPNESSAQLIKNGGAGGAGDIPLQDEYKTTVIDGTPASSDGEVSFTGLGKDEVLKYANDPFWVRLRWILFILFWTPLNVLQKLNGYKLTSFDMRGTAILKCLITIIVLAPRCPPRPDQKWYNTETVYKVLPKSFKDSNDDGIGDFKGMLEKLDYITETVGAKAIWISSIFANDGLDGDVGITNHTQLDKHFNVTLSDFTDWIKKMRKEGKKVILDLIPNQTSKLHQWFQKFVDGESPYKDYYVANKTSASGNWTDKYGDAAWGNEKGKDYYHRYSSAHPDLNLNNPDVVAEIKGIIRFWLDAGVSGFFIQDLEYLVEDLNEAGGQENNRGTLPFLEELRAIANEYSDKPGRERVLFGSVKTANKNQTLEYWGAGEKQRLHIVVPNLSALNAACNAKCVKNLIQNNLVADNHWLGFQLTTESDDRIATRLDLADDKYKNRLMVAHALQLLLPGTPINYYGDEIGQRNAVQNASLNLHGREVTMSPMQWNTEKNAGFTNGEPWCPVSGTFKQDNVEGELAHFGGFNPLEAFMKLVGLRKKESFQWGTPEVFAPQDNLLMFTRKAFRFPHFLILINTGNDTVHVTPREVKLAGVKDVGTVRYHSRQLSVDTEINVADIAQILLPYDVVVFEFPTDG